MIHAQYHGVTEAARRVHDEHIGIGRVFHLFRLPEVVEQSMCGMLQDDSLENVVRNECSHPDHAMEALTSITGRLPALQEGPIQIGDTKDLDSTEWLLMAGTYCVAFTAGARTYPYFRGTEARRMSARGTFTTQLRAGLGLIEETRLLLSLLARRHARDRPIPLGIELWHFSKRLGASLEEHCRGRLCAKVFRTGWNARYLPEVLGSIIVLR